MRITFDTNFFLYGVRIRFDGVVDSRKYGIWHGSIHRDTTFMYLQYCRPLNHLLPNVWRASYTISASIFVDVPYWQPYSTDKFISCVVPVPSQRFFHFGEEIVIAWSHIGWVRWMLQNLPLPAAQEDRDCSSGVTPCIVMKNDGVLYHQVSSFFSWVLDEGGGAGTCNSRQCLGLPATLRYSVVQC